MKQHWINKKGNSSCILFFNGWGMDENAVKNMSAGDYDICMFNDYSSFDPFNTSELMYEKIIVVAWSLGVCAANAVLAKSDLNISRAIAMNGTPYPWHNEWGIPEAIFSKTLTTWDETNRDKFNLRMLGGRANLETTTALLSQRSLENQQQELQFFYGFGQEMLPANYSWDLAITGTKDLIIPFQNQLLYWKNKTTVIQREWPHFPFNEFANWDEIIQIKE